MDLKAQVQGFMAKKEVQLSDELAEKYGVPPEEVAGVVNSFLKDTYGPAIRLAQDIDGKEGVVLLFIGRKDCNICRRSEPILESFLSSHNDLVLVKLDSHPSSRPALPYDSWPGEWHAPVDCFYLSGSHKDDLYRRMPSQ